MEVMPDHIHLLLDCKPQFLYQTCRKEKHGEKITKSNL